MAEVSGVWVWDEIVDFSDWTFGSVRVNFSVQTYPNWHYTEAYSKSRVTLNLVSKEGGDGNYYSSKWNSDTHRIWDFGSTPQTVPQEFLDFLMAHATPQNNVYPPTAELDKASFIQGWLVGRRLAGMRK